MRATLDQLSPTAGQPRGPSGYVAVCHHISYPFADETDRGGKANRWGALTGQAIAEHPA